MIAEPISKPDRAATFVTLSYGCLLAEAIVIASLLFDFPAPSGLLILALILPCAGVLFGSLGMRSSSTESVSKKAHLGRSLNAVVFVFVLILVIASMTTISKCACGDNNTFHTISNSLPS